MRGAVAFAVIVAIVAALVPVVLVYLRLHPSRVAVDDHPGRHGLVFETVTFSSSDGTPLSGWYLPAGGSTRAVVVAPGIDNNRLASGQSLPLASALIDAGFNVVLFDLRGEGESGNGPITFGAREQDDILAAVALARARGSERVGVLGFSLGGAAALLATARDRSIDAVVADSSFADLDESLTRELARTNHVPDPLAQYTVALIGLLSGIDIREVSPISIIGTIGPRRVLLVQGTSDETVPAVDSERLLAASNHGTTERWLVAGGRHAQNLLADPAAYEARIVAFFDAGLR